MCQFYNYRLSRLKFHHKMSFGTSYLKFLIQHLVTQTQLCIFSQEIIKNAGFSAEDRINDGAPPGQASASPPSILPSSYDQEVSGDRQSQERPCPAT